MPRPKKLETIVTEGKEKSVLSAARGILAGGLPTGIMESKRRRVEQIIDNLESAPNSFREVIAGVRAAASA